MENPQYKVGDVVFHKNNLCICEIVELTNKKDPTCQYYIKEISASPYGDTDGPYQSGDIYLRKLTKLEKALK